MKGLREELNRAAVFENRERASWLKWTLMVALVAGAYLAIASDVRLAFALVPLAALATSTATLLGHEGGHGSFSAQSRNNQALSFLALPLFAGISALYWKNKHNGLHHGHPNVLGSDPDIELWPMALSRAEYERSAPALQWFQRNLQGYLFWPAATLLAPVMRAPSYLFLLRKLRVRPTPAAWIDAACLVLHYALWIALPSLPQLLPLTRDT